MIKEKQTGNLRKCLDTSALHTDTSSLTQGKTKIPNDKPKTKIRKEGVGGWTVENKLGSLGPEGL